MDKFITFWRGLRSVEREDFAKRVGTTVGYIAKAVSVGQKFGPELCVSIERETSWQISRKDLRPDDWARIWPELSNRDVTSCSCKKEAA